MLGERERRIRWKLARNLHKRKTEVTIAVQGTGCLRRCSERPFNTETGKLEAEASRPCLDRVGSTNSHCSLTSHREQRREWCMHNLRTRGSTAHFICSQLHQTHTDFSTAAWLLDYSQNLNFVDNKYSFSWNWKTRGLNFCLHLM